MFTVKLHVKHNFKDKQHRCPPTAQMVFMVLSRETSAFQIQLSCLLLGLLKFSSLCLNVPGVGWPIFAFTQCHLSAASRCEASCAWSAGVCGHRGLRIIVGIRQIDWYLPPLKMFFLFLPKICLCLASVAWTMDYVSQVGTQDLTHLHTDHVGVSSNLDGIYNRGFLFPFHNPKSFGFFFRMFIQRWYLQKWRDMETLRLSGPLLWVQVLGWRVSMLHVNLWRHHLCQRRCTNQRPGRMLSEVSRYVHASCKSTSWSLFQLCKKGRQL